MKGCRSLTDEEISNVTKELTCLRDICYLIMGLKTGLRVSELLSLSIGSVVKHGQVADFVTVDRKNTKGKQESKTLPLSQSAKEAIKKYLDSLGPIETLNLGQALFRSKKTGKAITRFRAHTILKTAFNTLNFQGKVATHSLRKSYCQRVHKALGNDILKTKVAMAHKSLNSTSQYLAVDEEEVKKAILGLG